MSNSPEVIGIQVDRELYCFRYIPLKDELRLFNIFNEFAMRPELGTFGFEEAKALKNGLIEDIYRRQILG